MVSKGPHSEKVVKLANKINASCVIGNQDYQLLDRMGYMQTEYNFVRQPVRQGELVLEEDEELAMAMGFSKKAAQWLLQCPLILQIGDILDGQEFVAVHAGLFPGIKLEEQGISCHLKAKADPWAIMNIRNIYEDKASRETNKGEAWAEVWNKDQNDKSKPVTIVYGHDARRVHSLGSKLMVGTTT